MTVDIQVCLTSPGGQKPTGVEVTVHVALLSVFRQTQRGWDSGPQKTKEMTGPPAFLRAVATGASAQACGFQRHSDSLSLRKGLEVLSAQALLCACGSVPLSVLAFSSVWRLCVELIPLRADYDLVDSCTPKWIVYLTND